MDVCVCGAQVPFMYGGAELHMTNLVDALRERGHRADLVRLPTAWDRARIFDAALAWRLAPVDADLVIATNFPSYFVRHPRKVVWLFHQHRAGYDAADSSWSDFGLDDESLETQRLLASWDNVALGEATRLFSTSHVVADRLARYNGLQAEALYHPPPLADRLGPGAFGDYVFCPSRFAQNKRPDRMIDALAHVRSPTRAVLAGDGPLRAELEARARRAGASDRLDMPGFVDDDRLVALFRDALAVVYAPHDEDYGYVTLQAFLAGKPVITASDSGGVLEWVEDGRTGIVTDGSPEAIGRAIDRLAGDRDEAARLGAAGRAAVEGLDWGAVVDRLVSTT
jgi:glycosyltransferase involved in cell wall biosynthesis